MPPDRPQITVLDDDVLMGPIWQGACGSHAEVTFFNDIPAFLGSLARNGTRLVIIDRFFGSKDLVMDGFVQDIRQHGYKGPVLLSSDLRISPAELDKYGFDDQIEKRKVTPKHLPGLLTKYWNKA